MRSSMITKEETLKILKRSYEYIVALLEFILLILRFQLNHYLYEEFKKELSRFSSSTLVDKADWDKLVEPDGTLIAQLKEVEDKISGLKDSLDEVQRVWRKM
mmetsp:Transcript_3493/g.6468  ORF Transcript_3493/g.6468 Transcript_3493/m.6468 type:complete len:102 (+) Transcript_3493:805-1110(+)